MPNTEYFELLSSDSEHSTAKRDRSKRTSRGWGFSVLEDGFDSAFGSDGPWDAQSSKKQKLNPPEDDLIISTSPPIVTKTQNTSRDALRSLFSLGYNSDFDIIPERTSVNALAPQLSKRTTALLSNLSNSRTRKCFSKNHRADGKKSNGKALDTSTSKSKDHSGADEDTARRSTSAEPTRKPKLTEAEKIERQQEKEKARTVVQEQRAKEKEEQKERKRKEKEKKALEKQRLVDIAEVNKVKVNKNDATPEMIVDLPVSIAEQSVDTQVREHLKNLQVETTTYQSPMPNIVRWRRKVKARWNPELDHWEPLHTVEIQDERHVMCLMSANDFVDMVCSSGTGDDGLDVEAHIQGVKAAFPHCTPIYLIEGLKARMRKNTTIQNRTYQAAVLRQINSQLESSLGSQQRRARKKAADQHVDEDTVEDALLNLQVAHGCLIHQTATACETAESVVNFTQQISTVPYRCDLPKIPRTP